MRMRNLPSRAPGSGAAFVAKWAGRLNLAPPDGGPRREYLWRRFALALSPIAVRESEPPDQEHKALRLFARLDFRRYNPGNGERDMTSEASQGAQQPGKRVYLDVCALASRCRRDNSRADRQAQGRQSPWPGQESAGVGLLRKLSCRDNTCHRTESRRQRNQVRTGFGA
jgi:hypothetical protein